MTSKMPIVFMDVRQDLFYAYRLPSRLVRAILKVKRVSKREYPSFRRFSCSKGNHFLGDSDSDVKNAKFFCGRSSRPCLCIWLSITARLTHFEGQTSPKASIPLISTIFVCYRKPFFGDPDSDVKNANFFVYVRQDLIYAYGFPSRPVRPILKVKRPLKLAYPSFR